MPRAKFLRTHWASKPENCPYCGMRHIVTIVYGPITDKDRESVEKGDIYVGGEYSEGEERPRWACIDCGKVIYAIEDKEKD